ncbi:MAG: pyridoxal phosphate-dependent aminotransferase [Polyangiaceae bacterium]
MFSKRSAHDPRPNALTLALNGERDRGRSLLDLTVSNPTSAGIPFASEAILRALADGRGLVYEPAPFGLLSAREAVAAEIRAGGSGIHADRIVLTASTSEAYSFLFKLLADPGDSVLVPQPSYPLFEHLATFESVRVVPYPLAYDGEWHIDLPALKGAIDRTTRAIVVVSPNNPTGSYLKKDELRALAATGLPILSDEVFARYDFGDDPRRAASALDAAREASLVFALGGLSKLAALPQLKLAWTAIAGADERAVAGALSRLELIADTFLSVGTPVQRALPELLAASATARDAIRARTAANLAQLRALLATRGKAVTLLKCEGGWYATLRLPRTQTEQEWVLSLLEDDAVYVHPGVFFDFTEEAYVIVSLLTPEPVFTEGIGRLLARVDAAS